MSKKASKNTQKEAGLVPGGQVKFKYLFDDNYAPVYVSGAFGGRSPRGDFVLNFFFERQGLPISQSFSINEDGTLGPEDMKKCDPLDLGSSLVRQINAGIIISRDTAKELHKMLTTLIDEQDEKEEVAE